MVRDDLQPHLMSPLLAGISPLTHTKPSYLHTSTFIKHNSHFIHSQRSPLKLQGVMYLSYSSILQMSSLVNGVRCNGCSSFSFHKRMFLVSNFSLVESKVRNTLVVRISYYCRHTYIVVRLVLDKTLSTCSTLPGVFDVSVRCFCQILDIEIKRKNGPLDVADPTGLAEMCLYQS